MITEPVSVADTEPTAAVALQIRTLPMTKADILQAYTQAVNEVKLRSPGFTLSRQESCRDVTANTDTVLMQWKAFLSSVCQSYEQTVAIGDDVACRTYFPVFDTDFGCRLTDSSLIRNAVCEESGSVRTIRISFRDTEEDGDVFSQMRQCFSMCDGKTVLYRMAQAVPGLCNDTAQLTQTWMFCEVECRTDVTTGHLLSLKQKTVCEYLVCAKVSLSGTNMPFIARANVIRHLQYGDFNW